jgi:hypothetical protein
LRLKIAEAGPGADAKPIKRQLFELGEIPNRWRGWNQLYKREKKALFENLQVPFFECLALTIANILKLRRSFWEKGEIPPEDKKPEPETETRSTMNTPTIKEELIEKISQTPPIQVPLSIIKEEPVETAALPTAKKPQPEVILLDDTPPRVSKRTAANISTSTTPTIKTEPVDFGNVPAAACSNTQSGFGGGISKKAKLEQGTEISGGDEENDLVKLEEEEERLEEEILAAQRVADLIRKRNESKARIAALKARASTTPGRGSPS